MRKYDPKGDLLLAWNDSRLGWSFAFAVDAADNVYVADNKNSRVLKFTADGQYLLQWGSKGSGDRQFKNQISDIATDSAGNVYVVDAENYRIQKFTSDGQFLLKWGSEGNADGQFSPPARHPTSFGGIAVDATGNVFVVDKQIGRVQKFSPDGDFLLKWGSQGDGLFDNPSGIAVDTMGKVYVMNDNGRDAGARCSMRQSAMPPWWQCERHHLKQRRRRV